MFRYSSTISQSVMEVRMKPITEGIQHCLKFKLATTPRARVLSYQDYLGNAVHHFDIPSSHSQLTVIAESLVHMGSPAPLIDKLVPAAWKELDSIISKTDCADFLAPSQFARPAPSLPDLAAELGAILRDDPLTVVREIMAGMSKSFAYCPRTTKVDSPIDQALEERKGVCQDFSHIMIALVRPLGIPCRYVSGYLFHRDEDQGSGEDATHAWVEALLPGLGWIGFDPTNDVVAGERHIRVAVGRDYADVPPTRGVFQGDARSELSVAVQVAPSDAPLPDELPPLIAEQVVHEQEQQQQQQQQ
jgi:transglutaminase-like putative cysteine protease